MIGMYTSLDEKAKPAMWSARPALIDWGFWVLQSSGRIIDNQVPWTYYY